MVLLKWKIEQKKCRTRRLYLLLLFSLCGTFMVFIGGKACKNLNRYKAEQFGSSLVLHYIANQVRQSDGEDRIKVVEVDGISVLELEQNFDEVSYIKWIYCLFFIGTTLLFLVQSLCSYCLPLSFTTQI